jgi:hypothetical protein
MMLRKFALLVLLSSIVPAAPVSAVIIDDFESGDPWAVSETGNFAQFNLQGVTGGRRFLVTHLPGIVSFQPGYGVSWNLIRYFAIAYDPDIGALGFLNGNPDGAIILNLAGLADPVDLKVSARVSGSWYSANYEIPAGSSSWTVPTTDLSLSRWDVVEPIKFEFTSHIPGDQITGTLTRIEAVPEPTTGLLLGLGLLGVAVRRRV